MPLADPSHGMKALEGREMGVLRVLAVVALGGLTATGCATAAKPVTRPAQEQGSGEAMAAATDVATDAARQPFKDVGLMRKTIPPALARIADPYAAPTGPGCGWLAYEINQIDLVLSQDPLPPTHIDERTNAEKGREMAGTAAADAVRGALVGWIPARGVIRRLSGAEQSDRSFRQAEERGRLRRAFLRGLAQAQSCEIPRPAPPGAAPVSALPSPPKGR